MDEASRTSENTRPQEEEVYVPVEKVSVHSIRLMNGVTIEIEMHYDEKKWRWSNQSEMQSMDDLDELRLSFEATKRLEKSNSSHHPLILDRFVVYDVAYFFLKYDHIETLWSSNSAFSRWKNFRLGPLLKEMVGGGEGRVNKEIRKAEDMMKNAIRVRVDVLDRDTLFMDPWDRAFECMLRQDEPLLHLGCRGVVMEGEKTRVPAEILSLYSPYFHTLFYGDFKESESEWIPLHGVSSNDWNVLISNLNNRSSKWRNFHIIDLHGAESENLITALRMFDRFELLQRLAVYKQSVMQLLHQTFDPIDLDMLQALSDVLHTDEILVKFFDKFIDISSMDEYVENWKEWMTPHIERIAQQKRQQQEQIRNSEITVRLAGGGSIVVSLLNFCPRAVAALLDQIRAGANFNLTSITDMEDPRRPLLPPEAHLLLVFDARFESVRFCYRSIVKCMGHLTVLGVVIDGEQYVENFYGYDIESIEIAP